MISKKEVEKLVLEAVDYLKNDYELPQTGLIAGGSISNYIWSKLKNKPLIINDIDIFKKYEGDSKGKIVKVHSYNKVDVNTTYNGISVNYSDYNYFKVKEVYLDNKINTIFFKSGQNSYYDVIEHFDLNCTLVGYIIEKGEIIVKNEFVDFLNSETIKLFKSTTPAHSLLRAVKKQKELGCLPIDNDFIELIKIILYNFKHQLNRISFTNKYSKIFEENSEFLEKHFLLKVDESKTFWFKNFKNEKNTVYNLEPIYDIKISLDTQELQVYLLNSYTYKKREHLIYMSKLFRFYDQNYIDINNLNNKEIEDFTNFIKKYNIYKSLKGLTLSKQIELFNNLKSKVSEIELAGILTKSDLITEIPDDFELQLLLLKSRKTIHNLKKKWYI
jgi:hypothetical protein